MTINSARRPADYEIFGSRSADVHRHSPEQVAGLVTAPGVHVRPPASVGLAAPWLPRAPPRCAAWCLGRGSPWMATSYGGLGR